jgi:glycosyltransferase involved in cell wall biosynthesis
MTRQKKMRIVYVNHTGHVSGAEQVLLDILRGLDRSLYEPHVLCPAEGRLAEEIKAANVPCRPLPPVNSRFALRPDRILRSVRHFWKAIVATRRHVKELKPDLVHANTIRSGIAASIATVGTGIPVLWHVHDILPKHMLSTVIRVFALASRRTQVIAVSHASAREFCGALPFNGRVRTIHNGVDLDRFPAKSGAPSAFRNELSIPDDAFLVCAVGQVCARKGLSELLNAVASIQERAPQMHLAIVGRAVFKHEEGYLNSLLNAAAASRCADRVHFTGELRDVSSVLQGADLLVLNSRQEPFGLVLVEAMASGTPVVATRVGGIPEIVRDSENGWLIEKGDTYGLASKLLELSHNPNLLRQAAENGREATCPQFSFQRFQSNLQRVYSEFNSQHQFTWDVRNQPSLSEFWKT